MGKQRREQSQGSIFVDNPFVDGFLEWMGSREGRQCIEVRDVLWDLLEDAKLDAKPHFNTIQDKAFGHQIVARRHTVLSTTFWAAGAVSRSASYISLADVGRQGDAERPEDAADIAGDRCA